MILICFWLDRYEPEPARYRLAALGWGAVAAVALSFVGEQLLFGLPGANQFVNTAIAAPFIEESAKGLFLVAIVVFRRAEVHGLLDGIIYGALVGIGFAFVEDIVYYLGSLQSGQLGLTFFLRGIMGPFAHPLFTAATGLGIGIAVSTRRPAVRVVAPNPRFPGRGPDARDLERQHLLRRQRVLDRLRRDHAPAADRDLGSGHLGALPEKARCSPQRCIRCRRWVG